MENSSSGGKDIASAVVLAQHGNKRAKREIYLKYRKDIYYICSALCGLTPDTPGLCAEIFESMFRGIGRVDKALSFEKWFYSNAICYCGLKAEDAKRALPPAEERLAILASQARESAAAGDRIAFDHTVTAILGRVVDSLDDEQKTVLFYVHFAGADFNDIANRENMASARAEEIYDSAMKTIDRYTAFLSEKGVDISELRSDTSATLRYIASRVFIPDELEERMTGVTGAGPAGEETAERRSPRRKRENTEKKPVPGLSGLLLFIAVLAAALLLFAGIKAWRGRSSGIDGTTAARTAAQTESASFTEADTLDSSGLQHYNN